jgi:hypothetical protein
MTVRIDDIGSSDLFLSPGFTMADNSNPTDLIGAASSPNSTRINDEKPHATVEAMAVAGTVDKATTHVEISELVEGLPKSRWKNYARSAREVFSVKTVLQSSAVLLKLARFFGPGSIISVGYIDPDNFQTALSSGAEFGFSLLFMILVSNLIAIYLQVSISPCGRVIKGVVLALTGGRLWRSNWALSPAWIWLR